MSSNSPGRVAKQEPSVLNLSYLDDKSNTEALTALYDLFLTSHGPQGHAKVIHNNCGGEVTLTSDSDQILQNLSISKPVIKLIVSAIKDHLRLYSDGGILTSILTLRLILDSFKLDIHRRLIIEAYDLILKECMDFIESKDFPGKFKTDSHNDVNRKVIHGMFTSKPACLLFGSDLDCVCELALDTFKESRSNEDPTLLYVTVAGRSAQDSRLLTGALYPSPQISTYNRTPIHVLQTNDIISTALIQTSMAGDSESFLDVTYELTSDLHLSGVTLTQLSKFAESCIEAGVGVVICQKVVHPTIIKLLKQHGVLVLDRLGAQLFSAVTKLAGGKVLDPYNTTSQWQFTSKLSDVHHVVINKKSYVHLEGCTASTDSVHTTSPVYTVLLSHRTQHAVSELKEVYERCQHVLRLTTRRDVVLCGGGCWQTSLSLHLYNLPRTVIDIWCGNLGCNRLQLYQVIQTMISALSSPVTSLHHTDPHCHLVDTATGHHFLSDTATCRCGAIAYDTPQDVKYIHLGHAGMANMQSGIVRCDTDVDRRCSYDLDKKLMDVNIVDAYLPVINALRTSIAVSSMVLSIHNFMEDVN